MSVEHPAKFSEPIIDHIRIALRRYGLPGALVLDPFAGTGRIHQLRPEFNTYGVELEPEWAMQSRYTFVGNALSLRDNWTEMFDAVATSPTYGNLMADHHQPSPSDKSKRITYRHKLGRALSPGNSGQLQWGEKYREFHRQAWTEAHRVLVPGGQLLLNVSNHYRKGELIDVTGWHLECVESLGFELVEIVAIPTRRMRFGANSNLRDQHEYLLILRKTPNPTTPKDPQ